MKNPKVPTPNSSPDDSEIAKHVRSNWLRTILGIVFLGALSGGALTWFGLNLGLTTFILAIFTVVLPVFSWYNSAGMVKKLMRCQTPSANNLDHQRLVRLVDELFPATGLKVKP